MYIKSALHLSIYWLEEEQVEDLVLLVCFFLREQYCIRTEWIWVYDTFLSNTHIHKNRQIECKGGRFERKVDDIFLHCFKCYSKKQNESFTLTFHCSHVQNNEHSRSKETTKQNKSKKKSSLNPFNPVLLIIPFLLLINLKIRIIDQGELYLLIECRFSVMMYY